MKPLLFALLCLFVSVINAQNVGVGTTSPAGKLDISSSNSGVLIPRIALTATNVSAPVTSPVTSMMIYNTATAGSGATAVSPGFYYWNGSSWTRLLDNVAASNNLYNTDGTLTGNRTVTMGSDNLTFNSYSGNFSFNSSGPGTIALGNNNISNGNNSFAAGNSNTSSSTSSAAIGANNVASGQYSVALGSGNTAGGNYSFAAGQSNTATVSFATIPGGYNNTVGGQFGMAAGNGNSAVGQYSVAFGQSNNTSANFAIVPGGYSNVVNGQFGMAMGNSNTAGGQYSIAMGQNNTASADFAVALGGYNNSASALFSFAAGDVDTASGQYSVAMGQGNKAGGAYSTAFGQSNSASGYLSGALGGYSNVASGRLSTALGYFVKALSYDETALGAYNTNYTPVSTTTWSAADRLFGIGNGTSSGATSDALVILKNGNTGIGTSSPANKLEVAGNTKTTNLQMTSGAASGYLLQSDAGGNASWVNPNTIASQNLYNTDGTLTGNRTVTMGASNLSFTGTGTFSYDGGASADITMGQTNLATGNNGSMAVGSNDTASGQSSFAAGANNKASGPYTITLGVNNKASSINAVAVGSGNNASGAGGFAAGAANVASGTNSAVFGQQNTAGGYGSLAGGGLSTTSNSYSISYGHNNSATGYAAAVFGESAAAGGTAAAALGEFAHAYSYSEVSVGMYPTSYTPSSTTAYSATDRIFDVGNGASSGAPSDALTILKNGNTGIGNSSPSSKLDVTGNLHTTAEVYAGTYLRGDQGSFLFSGGNTDGSSNVVIRKDASSAYIFPWGTGTSLNQVLIGGGTNTNFYVTGTAGFNSTVSASGSVNSSTGYLYNNAAASGTYLRGNGSYYVSSGIQAADLPSGSGSYVQNQSASAQAASFNVSGTGYIGGNTGIGTVSPYTKLDVNGTMLVRGSNTNTPPSVVSSVELMTGRTNAGSLPAGASSADIGLQYAGGGYRHFIQSRHNSAVTGAGNDIDFYLNNSTIATGSSAPATGNTQVLTLESNNGQPRVGIGTTTPQSALQVWTPGAATSVNIGGYSASGGYTALQLSTSSNASGYSSIQSISSSGSAFGGLTLNPSGGYVSIGTTGFNAPLDVLASGGKDVLLGGGGSTGSELKFTYPGVAHFSVYNSGNNYLTFANTSGLFNTNSTGTTLMSLSSGGYLGIGTATPGATLDVNGTTRLGSPGTIIKSMQMGQSTIGAQSQDYSFTLNFPNAFANNPKVIAMCQTQTGQTYADNFSIVVQSVSTTSCVLRIHRTDAGTAWGQNLLVNWMAWDN